MAATRPALSTFMTPAGGSGTSTSKKSIFSKIGGALSNFSQGVAKSELGTANTLGGAVAKGLGKIPGKIGRFFQGGANYSQSAPVKKALTPTNTAQKIGFGIGEVGQFFAPGSAEESLYSKGAEHINQIPKVLGLVDENGIATKAGSTLTKAMKVALRGGITAGSTAGVTAAQGGTNKQIKTAAEVGGLFGAAGQALESFGSGLSKSLQKAGFKLTPAQEAKVSAKANTAAQFMTDNKILGSSETKFNKLKNLNNNLESTLQSSLPKNVGVPKQNIIDNITASIESLKTKDPAIYKSAKKDADEAIGLLKSQKSSSMFTKGGTVNVEDALNAKRSYGSAAFKQSKFSVTDPRVVSDGSYAVEQGYQKALESTLNKTNSTIKVPASLKSFFGGKAEVPLADFNKVYSQAITAKNLTNLARFKKDSGLLGRLFGLWAGESLGTAVAPGLGGKIIGGTVGEIASTRIPGAVRNVTERVLSTSPQKIIGAAKVGLGASAKAPKPTLKSFFNKQQ